MTAQHEYQHLTTIHPLPEPRQRASARASCCPPQVEATGGPAYLLVAGAVGLGAMYLSRR